MPSQKKQKADKQIVYSGQEKDFTIKPHLPKKISVPTITFSIVLENYSFWKIVGTIRLVLQKKTEAFWETLTSKYFPLASTFCLH